MLQNLTGWHALIILAIVVLIFGAAKLPALARSVGQSMRILKSEVQSSDDVESAAAEPPVAVAQPVGAAQPVAAAEPVGVGAVAGGAAPARVAE